MDSGDPRSIVFTKIRSLEPEYSSKIIGYLLLQDFEERDLLRLALGPEAVLQSLILKVKSHLGLYPNTLSIPPSPPSPSPLNPISRPPINGRIINSNGCLDFGRNKASFPSSNSSWSLNSVDTNESSRISPKSSHLLSFDTFRTVSQSNPSVSRQNNDGPVPDSAGDTRTNAYLQDEQQLSDYLSFLDDSSSKTEDFFDSRVPLGYSMNDGDTHLHRRSFSASDACFEFYDGGVGVGYKPCMYFSKGFCKNGDSCRFIHGDFADHVDGNGLNVGSPGKMDDFHRQYEEIMRMKLAYQQRMNATMFMARVRHLPYDKRMDFLLHPQAHSFSAFPSGDEQNWDRSPGRLAEVFRSSFGDLSNSASRQIYLTFPADSTFKDEDVANYFSIFGAVQDVRIPFQQKRMFGFVSFVNPETVKLVLARGNPHFICDSRVLVKPYKEKGKLLDKKQQHLLQQIERGNFSPCSSPSGIDPRELCDFPLARAKMFVDAQEMMRRKIELADLQRGIELERRRLMNLQIPEFKNESAHHHQRSLSIGSPGYLSYFFNQNPIIPTENLNQEGSEVNDDTKIAPRPSTASTAEQLPQQEANPVSLNRSDCNGEKSDSQGGSKVEELLVLPDTLFASTKKSADEHQSDGSVEADKSIALSATDPDNLETPTTSNGLAL